MARYAKRPAFISLKDHKKNFKHNTKCCLINPSRAIENRKTCKFIKFDIAEFYLSISAELLEKSINFARSVIEIKDKTIDIINHARKSLLFHDSSA